MKKRVNILKIVLVAVLAIIAFVMLQRLFLKKHSFEETSASQIKLINKTCPVMIGEGMRLDNVVALPNKVIQYNYTLTNKSRSMLDTADLKKKLEPELVQEVKNKAAFGVFRDNNATIIYNYNDNMGLRIAKISITPAQYK